MRDRPTIGGLALWKDRSNMLRLVWGTRGERELSFEGCLDGADVIVGRGHLPLESARVWLRLERAGHEVRALASADGVKWLEFGTVKFQVHDPVQIGLHAVGWIDRTVYSGAFPDGTSIRFDSVGIMQA